MINQLDFIRTAVMAAKRGHIDALEDQFDVIRDELAAGRMTVDENYQIGCLLGDLCEIVELIIFHRI